MNIYANTINTVELAAVIAFLVWFFRVVMSAASQWVMFRVPGKAVLYSLVAGFGEMLILGVLYGLTLKPAA